MSLSEKLFYNFSRLFHCSIIKVLAICFRLESLIFPRKTDCFLCFRFVVSLPRQQILSYQIISCLSTLFLTFFILLFKVFVASTSYILSNGSTFVNTFFKFSFVLQMSSSIANLISPFSPMKTAVKTALSHLKYYSAKRLSGWQPFSNIRSHI